MSHREEKAAVVRLLAAIQGEVFVVPNTELANALSHLADVRARLADRDAIVANLESAALEYGAAVKSGRSESDKHNALRCRAFDLYDYDAAIHPPPGK